MAEKFWNKAFWDEDGWDPHQSLLYTPPTTIIIALGANDHGMGVSVPQFIDVMLAFVDQLAEILTPQLREIVVLAPYYSMSFGRSKYEPALGEAIEAEFTKQERDGEAAAKAGEGVKIRVHHVDTQGWIIRATAPDGIHPDAQGNKVIASKLFESERKGWA